MVYGGGRGGGGRCLPRHECAHTSDAYGEKKKNKRAQKVPQIYTGVYRDSRFGMHATRQRTSLSPQSWHSAIPVVVGCRRKGVRERSSVPERVEKGGGRGRGATTPSDRRIRRGCAACLLLNASVPFPFSPRAPPPPSLISDLPTSPRPPKRRSVLPPPHGPDRPS